jgi:thiol-disulfide isomerase/thioredoxin
MKYWIALVLLISAKCVMAQNIRMNFPAFAGKTYDFVIFQGSKTITAVQDTIPANGKFTLQIPKEYVPYTGMSRWLITGTAEGGGLDMAIPGYDFSVSCLSKTPDNENISYHGFDAVNELNRLNAKQQAILDKFDVMSSAMKIYDNTHKLYNQFAKEQEVQVKAFEAFQGELKQNTNFNARFLPIVNITNGIPHRLTADYNQKALLANEFLTQKISFGDLYVSGHWQGIIQSWVVLQMNVVNDKAQFAQDFKLISDRMNNQVHYTDFINKLTYYLTQYGKDDYVDAIAKTVLASGKVIEYTGSLQVYLKAMVGMKAPDLVIAKADDSNPNAAVLKTDKLNSKHVLILFYKSGCGPCELTIQELKTNYERFKAKGIKIIAISADEEQQVYQNTVAQFPWKNTYCNFKGTSGINFKNYAVIGTPTMFLLDSKGNIIEKIATIAQLLAVLNK